MSQTASTVSLHDGAEILGVHYMTIYRYVRLGLLPAHKEGGSWRVRVSDLEDFQAEAASSPSGRNADAPWDERLEARMLAGDVNGAWSVVEAALASGSEPADIYMDVLAPALAKVGRRWEDGEIDVAEEHLATAVASRIIGRLGPRFSRRGRPRGTVITAMPPGDRHGLGLAMLADILRGAGYVVLDLGPDTPIPSLVFAVERADSLAAVCISVVFDELQEVTAEMVSAAREAVGSDVPVIVGGRAIDGPEGAAKIGADGFARDPHHAVDLIENWTVSSKPA